MSYSIESESFSAAGAGTTANYTSRGNFDILAGVSASPNYSLRHGYFSGTRIRFPRVWNEWILTHGLDPVSLQSPQSEAYRQALLAFSFNLDPTQPNGWHALQPGRGDTSGFPAIVEISGNPQRLRIELIRRRDGVIEYVLQESASPSTTAVWSDTEFDGGTAVALNSTWERFVGEKMLTGAARRFYRVNVRAVLNP